MLAQSSERSKIKKKVSPFFCLPAPFPSTPIFLCILPKGSHAHSLTFIYIRDSRLHVPPSPKPPRKLLSIHMPAPYGELLSILKLCFGEENKKPFVIPVNYFCWEQLAKNTIPQTHGTRLPGNWSRFAWAVWAGASHGLLWENGFQI